MTGFRKNPDCAAWKALHPKFFSQVQIDTPRSPQLFQLKQRSAKETLSGHRGLFGRVIFLAQG
jgi:hypothetical protein